jgi:hypothetical protein
VNEHPPAPQSLSAVPAGSRSRLPARLRRRRALAGAAIGLFAAGGLGAPTVGSDAGAGDTARAGVVLQGDSSATDGEAGDPA